MAQKTMRTSRGVSGGCRAPALEAENRKLRQKLTATQEALFTVSTRYARLQRELKAAKRSATARAFDPGPPDVYGLRLSKARRTPLDPYGLGKSYTDEPAPVQVTKGPPAVPRTLRHANPTMPDSYGMGERWTY